MTRRSVVAISGNINGLGKRVCNNRYIGAVRYRPIRVWWERKNIVKMLEGCVVASMRGQSLM